MVEVEVELILGFAVYVLDIIETEFRSRIIIIHACGPVKTFQVGIIFEYRIECGSIFDLVQMVIFLPAAEVVEALAFVSKFNEALVEVNLADVSGICSGDAVAACTASMPARARIL